MAEFNDIPGNISLGANQFVRRNASDTGYEAASVGSVAVVTKTGNYTATDADTVILCDQGATPTNYTITLPTAVGRTGKVYVVKKIDASTATVTIDPNSTETIDGVSTYTLKTENEVLEIMSDGANWESVSPSGFEEYGYLVGEPTGVDPSTPTTLAFSYGSPTSTITVTPTGSSFDVYIKGKKYTLTGAQNITFTTADGIWYLRYTSSGWVCNQNPWSIDADTVQVALVYVNTSLSEGLLADERHGITMDWATHARLHTVDGAQVSSGAAIADYQTVSNPSPTDVQFSLGSTTLRDEDITLTLDTLAAGGPYFLAHKTGSGNQWTWTKTSNYPYFASSYTAGAAYVQWNQFTGSSWQLTAGANNNWINYYVFASDFISPTIARFIIIPGQAVHGTLAAAQAESVLGLNLTGFPAAEFAPLWQITYQLSNTANYSDMPGRCRIAVNPVRLVGYKASVSSSISPTNHSTLSNRSDAGSHPATAIETTITSFNGILTSAETDVQLALDKIDDHTHNAQSIVFDGTATPALAASNVEDAIVELANEKQEMSQVILMTQIFS